MIPVSKLIKQASKAVANNSPVILTAGAVAGVLTTAILTGKAAVKADEIIRGEIDLRIAEFGEEAPEITRKDEVELTWRCYIPPALAITTTVTAIIAANHISSRRNATLLSLYSLTDTAFKEYKDKVVEQVGVNKEQKVRDSIAEDRVRADPPSSEIVILDGEFLCYELFTGRKFKCDMQKLRRAMNDINNEINHNMYASLSDFYNLIGLEPTSASDDLGWNIDRRLELEFTSVLIQERPMMAVGYAKNPTPDFHKVL